MPAIFDHVIGGPYKGGDPTPTDQNQSLESKSNLTYMIPYIVPNPFVCVYLNLIWYRRWGHKWYRTWYYTEWTGRLG